MLAKASADSSFFYQLVLCWQGLQNRLLLVVGHAPNLDIQKAEAGWH